jgi:hypothetical protein
MKKYAKVVVTWAALSIRWKTRMIEANCYELHGMRVLECGAEAGQSHLEEFALGFGRGAGCEARKKVEIDIPGGSKCSRG